MCRLCTESGFVNQGLCVRQNRLRSISYLDHQITTRVVLLFFFILPGLASDFVLCLEGKTLLS